MMMLIVYHFFLLLTAFLLILYNFVFLSIKYGWLQLQATFSTEKWHQVKKYHHQKVRMIFFADDEEVDFCNG
jgi:hypothetical protein